MATRTIVLGTDPTGNEYDSGSIVVTDHNGTVSLEMFAAADNVATVYDPAQIDRLIAALQAARKTMG